MDRLQVFLFGRFSTQRGDLVLTGLEAQKVQELFSYLLIYRKRSHPREKLADLLWPNSSNTQSKQYLRQTLYQLQVALEDNSDPHGALISVESNWIRMNPMADYWSDIRQFERAFALTQNRRGHELDDAEACALESAVQLYHGDLLESWYQDWSILERERVQNLYLLMLDKLMSYSAAHQEYERGIVYGSDILRCDVAHERTYRRLMQLFALAGDRSGALRQYERCVTVLAQELGVEPAEQTVALYQQIKEDRPLSHLFHRSQNDAYGDASLSLSGLLDRLTHVRMDLINAQRQVEQDIEIVKTALVGSFQQFVGEKVGERIVESKRADKNRSHARSV